MNRGPHRPTAFFSSNLWLVMCMSVSNDRGQVAIHFIPILNAGIRLDLIAETV